MDGVCGTGHLQQGGLGDTKALIGAAVLDTGQGELGEGLGSVHFQGS